MSTFVFNDEYRQTEEYQQWYSAIKRDYPSTPTYLIESAIMMHKTEPQYYKKAKDAKQVFNTAPKVRLNDKPKIIEGAVTISDAPLDAPTVSIEDVTE